jgi:FdhD protein
VGFCLTEGVISGPDDVDTIAYCVGPDDRQQYNVVTIRLRHPVVGDVSTRRFLANSSCGVCGKAALDDLGVRCTPVSPGPVIPASVVRTLPARLSEHQRVFGETGGLHAAARFDAPGVLRCVREDVGRHNALDKLVGNALLERVLPLSAGVLLVSGRLSFELVQKAAVAGIPVLCAVSAPSSLAVAAADRFGQTVVAFLRDERFNVYAHAERIDLES